MLTFLVVGETTPAGVLASGSAVEILHARDADEAVEKLGRNRRIDAVLILSPEDAAAIVGAIREDVLSPPPVFLSAGAPEITGTRVLEDRAPARLVELVARALQG
jgi:hypothetical protein